MAKPLKFHQTLNQAPRSPKHGQHRRADPPAHRHTLGGTDYGTGGSDQSAAWLSWEPAFITNPEPPAIPYAGIRTGELIGHRLWWVVDGKLTSLVSSLIWEPGQTVSGDVNRPVDGAAFYTHVIWGGVYSFRERAPCEREAEWTYLYDRVCGDNRSFVLGTIRMWGDVVEHQDGYRAEFAKIKSLDELYGDGDLDALRALYGLNANTGTGD